MRAVFLTHYYPPEVGAPQTRLSELASGLRRAHGIEVTVHTGFPHYPSGRILSPYRNRPLLADRDRLGTPVVRSAILPAANRGFARRLLNHLSLCVSSVGTAAASGPADVVLVETPPLFLAAAGVAYAAGKRAPLVVNVADRWPASAVALGVLSDRRVIRAAERLERWIYNHAAAVVVPTKGLAAQLPARRVAHIPPAVALERFRELPPPSPRGPLRVLYAGTLGLAQGLTTLVDAARLAGPQVAQVTIAGAGADADALRRRAARTDNVRFAGPVPAERVPELYAEADAAAVLLRDRDLFAAALPTKLLEGMAAGRPLLLAARGEAAAVVAEADAGIVVAPEDPRALACAMATLAAAPDRVIALGTHGRAAAARFDRPAMVARWAELLAGVAAHRARR